MFTGSVHRFAGDEMFALGFPILPPGQRFTSAPGRGGGESVVYTAETMLSEQLGPCAWSTVCMEHPGKVSRAYSRTCPK